MRLTVTRLMLATMAFLAIQLCNSVITPSYAQPTGTPIYARQRAGARVGGVWQGGYEQSARYAQARYGGYSYYPRQQAIAGSWYTRPYPYHFDYYRQRYSSAPQEAVDCPCAVPQEP